MTTALLDAPVGALRNFAVNLRDPEALYEIIDGIEMELPPRSMESGILASRLGTKIILFATPNELGEVYNEILVKLNLSDGRERNRRPDFIYVSYVKWPADKPLVKDAAWDIVPDICVEVVSPSDGANDLEEKLVEYFEAGIPQVWVVYPEVQTVYAYESRNRVKILGPDDTLTGGTALPGFELPLRQLFRTTTVQ